MTSVKNIWLVNVGEPVPGDGNNTRLLRTGILASELAGRGHRVTWFNSSVDHVRKKLRGDDEAVHDDNYHLILLDGRIYKKNVSFARIMSNRDNAREFRKLAQTLEQPDVILVGCPTIELTAAVSDYARARAIPYAVDFRDMWPDIFANALPKPARVFAPLLFAGWNRQIARSVRGASAVTGITDRFVDWALAKGNRKRQEPDVAFHLAVNPSFPSDPEIAAAARFWDEAGITEDKAKLTFCFAGSITKRLEFQPLISGALALSDASKVRLNLVFCGTGDAVAELQQKCAGEPHIQFAGWRNQAELKVLMQRSDAGLLPYPDTPDFAMSYPNKVGEYLMTGLPVITGLGGQTQDLLSDTKTGHFYQNNDPSSVTRLFEQLIANGMDEDASKRARAVGEQNFDGSKIYPDFADWIEQLD